MAAGSAVLSLGSKGNTAGMTPEGIVPSGTSQSPKDKSVRFFSRELPRAVEFRETERRWVGSGGWSKGRMGWCFMGVELQFGKIRSSGDGWSVTLYTRVTVLSGTELRTYRFSW